MRDQSESDTILPRSNSISPDIGAPSPRSIQLEEQVTPADEYAPKVRKPYTISKQRERWSEEEHRKFLEALKLHGRAWRRIEDHVGTKTAVQIRSHAQKFFSKVVRESNNGDVSSVKSIEIPPPRPKRKPVHPYPRKLAIPVKSGFLAAEKSKGCASPNLSPSESENQSPTSVLSAVGSDAFGTVDSSKPSESPSPVSSAEPSDFILEETRSSPSNPDNQACMKLELFPEDDDFVKEGSDEGSSTRCLKLFGKIVLVADSYMPSSTSGPISLIDENDEPASRTSPQCTFPKKYLHWDSECASSNLTIGPTTHHISSPLLPWGSSSYVSAAFPCTQVHNPIPLKGRPLFNEKDLEDKETQKEGSSTGSNAESVENLEIETQSSWNLVEESVRASVSSLFERRANSKKRMKGFLPYKRFLAETGISSSILTGEEREEQRTRLCL
ncbi:hypothetical protein RND71_034382 [Anisodus tanguticus]|uniref:Uncharacterized protein n=1 Tax=Anisodus tanguticus TaxID=243964 RepID=A0AAE1RAM6_9SOLA|nr:hypothetical protein RND71_034382 [Anisodus tanguticus]